MNFVAERQAIIARLLANWSTTPVRLENQPANPADNLSAGYVAVCIRDGNGEQVTLGPSPSLRFIGVIFLEVFVPRHALDGDILARTYAENLAAIFRLVQFQVTYASKPSGLITCYVPEMHSAQDEHEWWKVVVTCPYSRQLVDA
jgi:hypothetical protein